jgi:hypothetical protein
MTQGVEREHFWAAVSAEVSDEEYLRETEQWLDADLTAAVPRR